MRAERLVAHKVFVVTGANSGLGFHTALHLAAAADAANGPTTIVMAARDLQKGRVARDALLAELRYRPEFSEQRDSRPQSPIKQR